VIVLAFVLAAVITPPDIITQLSIALPLVAFYYLALLFAKIFNFGKG
jgi:sec-independent protein translocase protein TatC